MFQASRPGWSSSVLSRDHVLAPSRLSNTPQPSPPASRRPCAGEQARDLREPELAVLAVAEALARELPRLAEIVAAPDAGAMPFAGGGGVDRARVRIVDRVVDGPALAVGPARRPRAAVGVALQDEAALARSDEHHCHSHDASLLSRSLLLQTAERRETHRSTARAPGNRPMRALASASTGHGDRPRARGAECHQPVELGRSAISSAWRSRIGARCSITASATSILRWP